MVFDETVLKKFVYGELDDDQAAEVMRELERNPGLLTTLDQLAQSDTFTSRLRGMKAAESDSNWVEECIDRMRDLHSNVASNETKSIHDAQPGTVDLLPAPKIDDVNEQEAELHAPVSPNSAELVRLKQFRIVRLLGAGGMGMVYEAIDEKLGRRVALKVMKPEIAANPKSKARFLREAKAIAKVEHDNIVPIFHIDEENGTPFLAMPFLKGEPLDLYAQRMGQVPVREIVKIGRETALGLAAAHAHDLTHRDIKPGNLWMEKLGDGNWRIKILDFGLARSCTDREDAITQTGAVIGTPAYMAPEQARGELVDPRADLFSLGATLYMLATGQPPFGNGSLMSILTALAVETPAPVRALNPQIPAPLSELIGRLLSKNPEDRPASAKQTAALLQAIESEKPRVETQLAEPFAGLSLEQSRPESASRAKTVRSSRRLWIIATLLGFLVIGVVVAAYQLIFKTPDGTFIVELNDPSLEARFKAGKLRIYDANDKELYVLQGSEFNKSLPAGNYRIHIEGADGLKLDAEEFTISKGKETRITVRMAASASKAPAEEAKSIAKFPERSKQNSELDSLRRDQIPKELLAIAGGGDPRKAPEELVAIFGTPKITHNEAVLGLAYSPNGRWLATGGAEKFILLTDTATGVVKRKLVGHTNIIFALAFLTDNKTLISAAMDGTLRIWDVDKDKEQKVVKFDLGPTVWIAMALSGDGKHVAVGADSGVIRLWKWGAWDQPADLDAMAKKVRIRALAFDPAGETLAAGGYSELTETSEVHLFNVKEKKVIDKAPSDGKTVQVLRFSRDGKKLAIGGLSPPIGTIRLWDIPRRKVLCRLQIFRDWVNALDISDDGKTLAVADGENGVHLIDVAKQEFVRHLDGEWGMGIRSLSYSPDGKYLALGALNGIVQFWTADLSEQRFLRDGPRQLVWSTAAHPGGMFGLFASNECVLYRRDFKTPEKSPPPIQFRSAVRRVFYAPDGKTYWAVVGTFYWIEDCIYCYDSTTHQQLHDFGAVFSYDVAMSPDSRQMAICGFGKISLHEASTGKLLHRFDDKEGHIRSASWSAGGKELVTCNLIQKTITIWNVESGLSKLTWDAQGHVNTCSYDPQGRWIASGDLAGNITLWNAADGKKIRALSGHTRAVHRLRFSPDGARLVSSSEDGTLRIWNPEAARARSIVEVTNSYPLISPSFDFDRSGRFIIVSANNGLTYILKIH